MKKKDPDIRWIVCPYCENVIYGSATAKGKAIISKNNSTSKILISEWVEKKGENK